jgi:hypothetical protein
MKIPGGTTPATIGREPWQQHEPNRTGHPGPVPPWWPKSKPPKEKLIV